jgi:hypothetical protein
MSRQLPMDFEAESRNAPADKSTHFVPSRRIRLLRRVAQRSGGGGPPQAVEGAAACAMLASTHSILLTSTKSVAGVHSTRMFHLSLCASCVACHAHSCSRPSDSANLCRKLPDRFNVSRGAGGRPLHRFAVPLPRYAALRGGGTETAKRAKIAFRGGRT